jgi:hypothetical protein
MILPLLDFKLIVEVAKKTIKIAESNPLIPIKMDVKFFKVSAKLGVFSFFINNRITIPAQNRMHIAKAIQQYKLVFKNLNFIGLFRPNGAKNECGFLKK